MNVLARQEAQRLLIQFIQHPPNGNDLFVELDRASRMIEFAIDPTRLSRSLRMISVMKYEFTLRMRSAIERRKFMCNRLGASSRMCWKVCSLTAPSRVGSAADAIAECG